MHELIKITFAAEVRVHDADTFSHIAELCAELENLREAYIDNFDDITQNVFKWDDSEEIYV